VPVSDHRGITALLVEARLQTCLIISATLEDLREANMTTDLADKYIEVWRPGAGGCPTMAPAQLAAPGISDSCVSSIEKSAPPSSSQFLAPEAMRLARSPLVFCLLSASEKGATAR
jgi:hypothetical protein